MYLLGEEFQAAFLSPFKLIVAVDADLSLTATSPTTIHSGFEFSPSRYLTLRVGMDQNQKSGWVQNNLTSGLSLKLAGVGIHYAYHPYAEAWESATHYL